MEWQHDPDLAAVRSALEARLAAEARLAGSVSAARAAGHSWELIGAALDMSRQAAWERFRHLDA